MQLETIEQAIVVIGLNDDLVTELVLWGDTFDTVGDVSFPVPPFKPPQFLSSYQLLVASRAAP